MATGSGVGATVLTALKAHLAAVAVGATVVVGGGAAAAAVATGAVQLPAQANATHVEKTPGAAATHAADQGTSARANACATNGDAQHLAATYAAMFQPGSGSTKTAEQTALSDICAIFVGTDGHAVGLGEVRQALDVAAAIETHTATNAAAANCLTALPTNGKPDGTPGADGKPEGTPGADHSTSSGQPSATVPTADEATTSGLLASIFKAVSQGTPLDQLARTCGAAAIPLTAGSGDNGSGDSGTPGAKPTGTPGAKPTGTPGAKPTGTPGSGHP